MKSLEIIPLQYCRRIHTAPISPRNTLQSRDLARAWHSSHGRSLTSANQPPRTPRCPDNCDKVEKYIPRYYDIVRREGDVKSNCFDLDLDPEGEEVKALNSFRRYPAGRKLLRRECSKQSLNDDNPDHVGLGNGLSYDLAERYYLVKLFKEPANLDVLRNYAGWLEEVDRLEDAEKM